MVTQSNSNTFFPPADPNKAPGPGEEDQQLLYDPALTWPKISIVTPSFNQGIYIEETIRSVLLQNYPNLEYIIIDGGSSDETVEIIKKYEDKIKYWVSEPDRGQSHAINKGLALCTGEIFNWLNSDDTYLQGTLQKVALAFRKDSSIQFVSGYENQVEADGNTYVSKGTYLLDRLEQTIELCEVTQPSTFFRLAAIRKIHGVSEDLHYIMDGEMWVKLLLCYGQKNFIKIHEPLANFRLHENSKTVSNTVVNNFLYERASIIIDLQRCIGVPAGIRKIYQESIYKTPVLYELNRDWQMDPGVISRRKLRIYFIKKFIINRFINGTRANVLLGIKILIQSGSLDLFLLKSTAKFLFNKYPSAKAE